MSISVASLMQIIEKIAPKKLAYEWDNVGLLLGNPTENITKILVSLDINEEVVEEAIANNVNIIITHHPLIYKPIKSLRWDTPVGKILKRLTMAGINVYCAHTNLDISNEGVNHILSERIGLKKSRVLQVGDNVNLFKFVVFVPASHLEQVKNALAESGAGWIGNYSHCAFLSKGIGTFMPLEGSTPFIGQKQVIEEVEEIRLETVASEELIKSIIAAVKKVHPYEEVAYDIYPLKNSGSEIGLGRIGELSPPMQKEAFIEFIKFKLEVPDIRIAGNLPEYIEKVAVCGGSGGNLVHQAVFKGAQIIITGDVNYHQAQEAIQMGLCVIDAGHGATEKLVVPHLADRLGKEINIKNAQVEVLTSQVNTEPWSLL